MLLLAKKVNNGRVVCLAEEYDGKHKESSIVTRANGQRPVAEQIYANEESEKNVQALIAVQPRYFYLKGFVRGKNKVFIRIYRIIRLKINQGIPMVEVKMFNKLTHGKWLLPLYDWLKPAVAALTDKLLNPENITIYAGFPKERRRQAKKRTTKRKKTDTIKPPV